MAVGFASPEDHQLQQEATVNNAIDFARANLYSGESEMYCIDCDEEIPEKRRSVLKGVKRCVQCQSKIDKKFTDGLNRRASKDALLR